MILSIYRVATLKPAVLLLALVTVIAFKSYSQQVNTDPATYHQQLQYSSLLFMENKGQVTDVKGKLRPDILFTANSGGAKLYLSANSIHYQFTKIEYPKGYDPHKREPIKDFQKQAELQKQIKTGTHRFSLELQGANLHPAVSTEKQSAYTENYYLAHCPNGITGVHGYEKIIYKNVYPNIDWVIYSKGGFMEYDFLVHPGGNPSNIKLKIKDAESVSITAGGELLMKTSLGEVMEKAPISYSDGAVVESHFKQLGDGTIGFDVLPRPGQELKIDPSVVWATYYGGSGDDQSRAVCVDRVGSIYITGTSDSRTGIAAGGFQDTLTSTFVFACAYLVKFNRNGTRLWGTYYCGNLVESGYACTTDTIGNVYLTGSAASTMGVASGGFQDTLSGNSDAFLVKFSSSGIRLWATYFGGNDDDEAVGCTTDNTGNIYLCGRTESPTGLAYNGFQNTFNGVVDAFLVKFSSNGNRLWATYYGGSNYEVGFGCATDASGNVYLSGETTSSNAIASGGFQNTLAGFNEPDAFLVKFSPNGARIWGTYYGGSDSEPSGYCTVDGSGNVYLTGQTHSTTGIASGGF